MEIDEENRVVIVQKFVENQLRAKKYKVKIQQIILVEKGSTGMFNAFPTAEVLQQDENRNNSNNLNYEEEVNQNLTMVDNEADQDIRNFFEEQNNTTAPRITRHKPRIDYSAFNESGEKIVKVQKMKIDFDSECSYCTSRKHSNFYHSEKLCQRKKLHLAEQAEQKDEEDENLIIAITSENDDALTREQGNV